MPSAKDAARIAVAINARSLALHGVTEESAEGVAEWFRLPSLDPAADMRLAVGERGTGEGYADVSGPDDGSPRAWVDLRVRPGCTASLELLFGWAEARAQERVGAGGAIRFFVDEADEATRARLAAGGYAVIRSSFVMERPLDDTLEPPVWPAGLELRPFEEAHAHTVHAAQQEAFADHWGFVPETYASWRSHNLGSAADVSLWRIAWDGDEVAGLCLNRPRRGEDDTVGWVAILAVRRPWRRRGLGEALLHESFLVFATQGKLHAALGVDAESTTNAVALYERVGMHVVRRRDTWERLT